MVVDQLRRREVDSKIVITDAEVDAYLKTHGGTKNLLSGASPPQAAASVPPQSAGPVMLGLAQLLVAVPENASQSTVDLLRKKAQVILGKLRGGPGFASMAAAVSVAWESSGEGKGGGRR